ncbi:hypothetical protein D3C85_1613560 [compost metagenome]
MLHIGRHPLQPIGQQLAQRTDILVLCGKNAYFLCFQQHFFIRTGSPEGCVMTGKGSLCSRCFQPVSPLVTKR